MDINRYHCLCCIPDHLLYVFLLGFGIDFDSTTLRVTINPGAVSTEVCVPIIIDDVQEDTEMFYLSIILDTFTPKNVLFGPNTLVGGFIIG